VEEGKSCVLTCATGSVPAARQTPITWIRDSVPSNSVNRSPCVNPGGYLADYTVMFWDRLLTQHHRGSVWKRQRGVEV
jgi:hypothetical protein